MGGEEVWTLYTSTIVNDIMDHQRKISKKSIRWYKEGVGLGLGMEKELRLTIQIFSFGVRIENESGPITVLSGYKKKPQWTTKARNGKQNAFYGLEKGFVLDWIENK